MTTVDEVIHFGKYVITMGIIGGIVDEKLQVS